MIKQDNYISVEKRAEKLYNELFSAIDLCHAILNSDEGEGAKECILWVLFHELNLIINSKKNTPEVWKKIKKWQVILLITNFWAIGRKTSKMSRIKAKTKEVIEHIRKMRK